MLTRRRQPLQTSDALAVARALAAAPPALLEVHDRPDLAFYLRRHFNDCFD